VWEDDSVELMIAPPGEKPPFDHIIVNAVGSVYDEKWIRDAQGGGRALGRDLERRGAEGRSARRRAGRWLLRRSWRCLR